MFYIRKTKLTGKNLSVLVDEIYKQHNAKLIGENPVKRLEKELSQTNKSIGNIMKAIEQGIITDTTKERLTELETKRRELQEKLILERMQEQVVLSKKEIETYLKKGIEQEPEMMIELLVDKVFVYDDYVELILHYTGDPTKPKDRLVDKEETEEKDESPEGVSLRGSLIYRTECSYDMYSYKGRNKKGLEPIFKGVCKMSVFIEI